MKYTYKTEIFLINNETILTLNEITLIINESIFTLTHFIIFFHSRSRFLYRFLTLSFNSDFSICFFPYCNRLAFSNIIPSFIFLLSCFLKYIFNRPFSGAACQEKNPSRTGLHDHWKYLPRDSSLGYVLDEEANIRGH